MSPHSVTPACVDAYNYGYWTKKSPNNAGIVLGSPTKAEKGQGNSFGPTLGLSLNYLRTFAIIVFFFSLNPDFYSFVLLLDFRRNVNIELSIHCFYYCSKHNYIHYLTNFNIRYWQFPFLTIAKSKNHWFNRKSVWNYEVDFIYFFIFRTKHSTITDLQVN